MRTIHRASTVHVPSTISGSITTNSGTLVVIQSPSLDSGASASSNIEASDRDRTVNVGNDMGRCTINLTIRGTTGTGILNIGIMRVERSTAVPIAGTGVVPSLTEIGSQGMQQAQRTHNSGKVVIFDNMAYTAEITRTKIIRFSPKKYRLSKVRAGDYWIMQLYNKGPTGITYDFEARYREFQ